MRLPQNPELISTYAVASKTEANLYLCGCLKNLSLPLPMRLPQKPELTSTYAVASKT
jgi:hypothetical protein